MFLFDATQTFSIGAFGGSLGYANRVSGSTTETGLSGGYIGIGLDEYGNFVRNSEGKNGGTADLAPNSIALRGPQKNSKPYRYLTHTQLQTNSSSNTNSIDYNTVTSTRPTNSQFYRKVKIYIEPIGTISVPKYRIRVLWTTTPNGTDTQHISYETTDPIPALLKLGFGASTGGGFNYHEIRNLYITTPGNVRINKEVDKPNVIIGDDLTYTGGVLELIGGVDYKLTDKLTLNGEAVMKNAGEKLFADEGTSYQEKTAFEVSATAKYAF